MKNPWTKKNPFLSMWLSGAHAAAGAARSRATAAGKRQASAATTETVRQLAKFWTAGLGGVAPPRRRRRG